jgi:hypothetical protein
MLVFPLIPPPFIDVEPFVAEEPFKPVPTEPDTLPEVAAVPLFHEPVVAVPLTEPEVPPFMLMLPLLFQLLKFMLVLEPGIAVNTQSPEKSSLSTPPLTGVLFCPVE